MQLVIWTSSKEKTSQQVHRLVRVRVHVRVHVHVRVWRQQQRLKKAPRGWLQKQAHVHRHPCLNSQICSKERKIMFTAWYKKTA